MRLSFKVSSQISHLLTRESFVLTTHSDLVVANIVNSLSIFRWHSHTENKHRLPPIGNVALLCMFHEKCSGEKTSFNRTPLFSVWLTGTLVPRPARRRRRKMNLSTGHTAGPARRHLGTAPTTRTTTGGSYRKCALHCRASISC